MTAARSERDFFSVVQARGWFTAEQLDNLRTDSAARSIPPLQAALERGWLDSARLDIVMLLMDAGEPIPGYEIVDLIGVGGMGVVYKAVQKTLQRVVAIKTIQLREFSTTVSIERFEQEARTLAQLHHPQIVSAIDYGRSEGRVYLVMEYVEGVDMTAHVRRHGALPEMMVWRLARQAALGLAHAEQKGVVHRDIKPGNLILVHGADENNAVAEPLLKIADLGLARLVDDDHSRTRLTMEGVAVGTPQYMAPEQLEGQAADWRCDLYALGATVYELLSSRPPFPSSSLSVLMSQKVGRGPRPLAEVAPQVSAASARLVEKMMRTDPSRRPTYAEVIREIDSLIFPSGAPRSETTAISETAMMPSLRRRSPLRRWLAVAVASLAMIALGAFIWRSTSSPTSSPAAGVDAESSPGHITPPARARLLEAGAPMPLFNGRTLRGWQQVSGNWIAPPDEFVLAGTDGMLRKVVVRQSETGTPAPLPFYRFEVIIDVSQGTAGEVHFGLSADNEQRYVCRLSTDSVQVGKRDPSTGQVWEKVFEAPRAMLASRPHSLVVERQPGGWFVDVDELPLAGVPFLNGAERPEVLLSAVGGPVLFSDLLLTELQTGSVETDDASSHR